MRQNRARALSIGLLASAVLSACGGGSKPSLVVTDVVVSKSNLFFTGVGQSARLGVSVVGRSDAPVTWTSSAPDQVGVDPSGVVSALKIGSAQIFAEAGGIRSLPTFVVVAEPAPGALLLTDDQVLAVGPPLGLDPGNVASIGTQYEVRVSGVSTPPSAGTPVLALGDAPVAGTVASTRVDGGALVLTLQLAPLYQLLSRYDIELEIDIGQYPSQDLAAFADTTSPPSQSWPVWPPAASAAGTVTGATELKSLAEPFHAFECDPSAKATFLKKEVSLNESGTVSWVTQDIKPDPTQPPTYVLRKLTGTLTADGKVGLKLGAGFSGKVDCRAQKQALIKCFGWFSIVMTPAIRYGVGATLEGSLEVAAAELSIEGKVGGSYELGWECKPPQPCQAIANVSPINEVKPKMTTPDEAAMQLKLSGMFYGLLGIDAAFGLGTLASAGIVEGRVGPKQSIDLEFESDQASNTSYASTFDLKLAGVVEPGKGIQDALKKDIDDDGTSVKFQLQLDQPPIAESPKGTFTVDKTTANIGDKVTLTVDLTPSTINYGPFGYQVMSIEIYRLADGDTEYKPFKCSGPTSPLPTCTIAVSTSGDNQTHFQTLWTVTEADVGTNTLAAFVRTIFSGEVTDAHIPYQEVAANTQQQVTVPCFSSGPTALRALPAGLAVRTQAATCADQWKAALTYDSAPVGSPAVSLAHHTANLTFVRNPNAFDPTGLEPQWVATSGTLGVSLTDPDPACNIMIQPGSFTFPTGDPSEYSLLVIDYTQDPPAFSFAVADIVKFTATETCPDHTNDTPTTYYLQIGGAGFLTTPSDTSIVGHSTGADGSNVTWNFSR